MATNSVIAARATLAHDHQQPAIVAVGEHAGGKREQQPRQPLDDGDDGDEQRVAGDRRGQPGVGDEGDPVAEVGDRCRAEQAAVVATESVGARTDRRRRSFPSDRGTRAGRPASVGRAVPVHVSGVAAAARPNERRGPRQCAAHHRRRCRPRSVPATSLMPPNRRDAGDRGHAELATDEELGGLVVEAEHRTPAVVVEEDRPVVVVGDQAFGGVAVTAPEVQALWKDHDVGGEAVTADVRALPHVVALGTLTQHASQWPSERCTARIVAAVGAHQHEWIAHEGATGRPH